MHKDYISDPEIRRRVNDKIMEWQRGKGREKYIAIKTAYDKSEKRTLWRRKKYGHKIRLFKKKPPIHPQAF